MNNNLTLKALLLLVAAAVPLKAQAQVATATPTPIRTVAPTATARITPTPVSTPTPRPITSKCVAPSMGSFTKLLQKASIEKLIADGYTKPQVNIRLTPANAELTTLTALPSSFGITQSTAAPLDLTVAGTTANAPGELTSCSIGVSVKITATGTKNMVRATGRSTSTIYVKGTYK